MRNVLVAIIALILLAPCSFAQTTVKISIYDLMQERSNNGYLAKKLYELGDRYKKASTPAGKKQIIDQMNEAKEKLCMTEEQKIEIATKREKIRSLKSLGGDAQEIERLQKSVDDASRQALKSFDETYYSFY